MLSGYIERRNVHNDLLLTFADNMYLENTWTDIKILCA